MCQVASPSFPCKQGVKNNKQEHSKSSDVSPSCSVAQCWVLSLLLPINCSYPTPPLRNPTPDLCWSEEGKGEKSKKEQDFCGLFNRLACRRAKG